MTIQGQKDSSSDLGNKSDSRSDSLYEDSAAYNISRSKQLIRTLEKTAQQSATMVHKARSFHEMHKMLSVSRLMSEKSKARLHFSARQRLKKTDKSESS